MIHYEHDKDIFDFHVDALVNTVNCVGVMGKGLALQFKQRFPQNFKTYKKECDASNVKIGQMLIHDNGFIETPRFIINFPTKQHWRSASKIEYIEAGLKDLKECIKKNGIKSIVIPPLGCGNGGLNWKDVRSLIEEAFSAEDIDLYILEPTNKFTELKTKEDVDLTPFRAVFLKIPGNIENDSTKSFIAFGYSIPRIILPCLEVQRIHQVIFQFHAQFA